MRVAKHASMKTRCRKVCGLKSRRTEQYSCGRIRLKTLSSPITADYSGNKRASAFGPRDCMGWSPPLQGGNSGGFDSHEVHQPRRKTPNVGLTETADEKPLNGSLQQVLYRDKIRRSVSRAYQRFQYKIQPVCGNSCAEVSGKNRQTAPYPRSSVRQSGPQGWATSVVQIHPWNYRQYNMLIRIKYLEIDTKKCIILLDVAVYISRSSAKTKTSKG